MDYKQSEIPCLMDAAVKELIQMNLFNLSEQQQRVVIYLIGQVSPDDEDSTLYEFSINDFCEVCGIDPYSSNRISELMDFIKEISDKGVWIKVNDRSKTVTRWIAKAYIDPNDNTIRIRLDEMMKPFLLQLKEKCAQNELLLMFSFKSKYTMRMYELIKTTLLQEPEARQREYDLDEFRQLMGAETYQTYQTFKTRALVPAIEEINQQSDMMVSYEPVKRGRSVAKLLLAFGPKPPKREERSELELNQVSLWDAPEGEGRL